MIQKNTSSTEKKQRALEVGVEAEETVGSGREVELIHFLILVP